MLVIFIMAKPKPQAEPNNKTEPVEDTPSAEDELQVDAADIELSEEAAQLVLNLQAQIDEAVAARQRALADFRNYQKRAAENEIHANKAGSARIARSLLSVVDQFDMALDQDTQQLTVEQLLSGIRLVREELVKALETHGVIRFKPEVGDEFDPMMHEAMMRQASEDVEPNHIVSVLQVGYKMGDLVLRPAKVAIAELKEEGDK